MPTGRQVFDLDVELVLGKNMKIRFYPYFCAKPNTMPDFKIRKAKKEDMPDVLLLIKELAAFEKAPDAVEVTAGDLQRDGFGNNPLFTCFVAEAGGKIQGMALVYFRYSTWKGKTLHLEDLVVRQEMRKKGIGNLLFRCVMEFASENKANRVEWEVLDWNTDAIKFYEKAGASIIKDWYLAKMSKKDLNSYLKQPHADL